MVIRGSMLDARKPIRENVVNSKIIQTRDIDRTILPANLKITDIGLSDPGNHTKITIAEEGWGKVFSDLLPSLIGTVIFILFLVFVMGRMGGGMGGPMAFIRSRARIYDPLLDEKVTFADVAGCDEEKSDLIEIVDFLKNPQKYKDL